MKKNLKEEENSKNDMGIIVPPGCESNRVFSDSGERVTTYMPNSYRPYVPRENKLLPHPMNGRCETVSVPKDKDCIKNMTDYLMKFKGGYVCFDLWMENRIKIKKCGVLMEVGENFMVIKDGNSFSLVDLKPVCYMNIYCRG